MIIISYNWRYINVLLLLLLLLIYGSRPPSLVDGRLLATCGMSVGWKLAGRGLNAGWTSNGRVVLDQPTSNPPPVHVTACWTFNGPYCNERLS